MMSMYCHWNDKEMGITYSNSCIDHHVLCTAHTPMCTRIDMCMGYVMDIGSSLETTLVMMSYMCCVIHYMYACTCTYMYIFVGVP